MFIPCVFTGRWERALCSLLSPSECSITSRMKVFLSLVRQRESTGLTNWHSVRFTWLFPEHPLCARSCLRPMRTQKSVRYSIALIQMQEKSSGGLEGELGSLRVGIYTYLLKISAFELNFRKQEGLDAGPAKEADLTFRAEGTSFHRCRKKKARVSWKWTVGCAGGVLMG